MSTIFQNDTTTTTTAVITTTKRFLLSRNYAGAGGNYSTRLTRSLHAPPHWNCWYWAASAFCTAESNMGILDSRLVDRKVLRTLAWQPLAQM